MNPGRPEVAIVYSADCPNVGLARLRVRTALRAAGWAPRWREWDRESPGAPAFARKYGSPTVLVGGRDVSPEAGPEEASRGAGSSPARCRLYADDGGVLEGAPPLRAILDALTKAERSAAGSEEEESSCSSAD